MASDKTTKRDFMQVANCAGEAPVLLLQLPQLPDELRASQPQLFDSVFNTEAPFPNPIDPGMWASLVNATKCRTSRLAKQGVLLPTMGNAAASCDEAATMTRSAASEFRQR